jgi:hypothetical protein
MNANRLNSANSLDGRQYVDRASFVDVFMNGLVSALDHRTHFLLGANGLRRCVP